MPDPNNVAHRRPQTPRPHPKRVRMLVQLEGGAPIEVTSTSTLVTDRGEVMATRDPGMGNAVQWRNIGDVDYEKLNEPA